MMKYLLEEKQDSWVAFAIIIIIIIITNKK
jgi:hypothetical protein